MYRYAVKDVVHTYILDIPLLYSNRINALKTLESLFIYLLITIRFIRFIQYDSINKAVAYKKLEQL